MAAPASIFELLTFVGALASAVCLYLVAPSIESAPAMGAFSAFGIGLTVVPYCLAAVFHRNAVRARARHHDIQALTGID